MVLHSGTTRVRTHYLRIPTGKTGLFGLVGLAFGILISYSVAFLIQAELMATFGRNVFVNAAWAWFALFLGAFVGPTLFVLIYHATGHAGLMRPTQGRTSRLDALAQHPESRNRLPHRLIERYLRGRYFTERKLRRCLLGQVPNQAFVIWRRDSGPIVFPPPATVAFEPISTLDVDERAALVTWQHAQTAYSAAEASDADVAPQLERRTVGAWVRSCLRALVTLAFLALLVYGVIHMFRNPYERAIGLVGLLAIGVLALCPLFWQRRWWIVPGGLVFREDRFWNRRPRWGRITPADSPFLMDWRAETGLVVHKGRALSFHCNEMTAWLAVAAWRNTAPPPTLESVRAFLQLD